MPRVTYDLTPPPGADTPEPSPATGAPATRPDASEASPSAAGATTAPGASYKQLDYLSDLLRQREISEEAKTALEARMAVQRELNDKHGDRACPLASPGLTKDRAHDFIDRLLKQPRVAPKRVPRDQCRSIVSEVARDAGHGVPSPDELASGNYAIKNESGELRFYRVWRGTKNPNFVKLYVQHGNDESEIPWGHELRAILKAIVEDGQLNAARRYGLHIGRCSNPKCGRRLTNRVSRLLGIGPVCGGHHCSPEIWKAMKERARAALRAAGLDPDVDVEDTDDLAAIREAAGLAL